MAYTPTIVVTPVGSGDFVVTINEVESGTATEATITGLPIKGEVRFVAAQLVSGTGTTIDPVIGHITNPGASALTKIIENDTAAAGINVVSTKPIPYYDEDGTLFYRSICDAGADNVVSVRIYISSSWS